MFLKETQRIHAAPSPNTACSVAIPQGQMNNVWPNPDIEPCAHLNATSAGFQPHCVSILDTQLVRSLRMDLKPALPGSEEVWAGDLL